MKATELINESREFAAEELFFSTTDLTGHIQRANSVFRRIAGYSWNELNAKPHNIIRHPEMPRIVFQILWDHIQGGHPVVAFVKNLAHDGRFYWVVALVTPMPGGYLSVRFKPTSPLLATVKSLYAELRAVEAAIESESKDRKAAVAASREALDRSLHALGFCSYDDFMGQVLKKEMQCREAHLSASAWHSSSRQVNQDGTNRTAALDALRAAAGMFDKLVEVLNTLFGDLEAYVGISQRVRETSGGVTDISDSLRVSALNGVIAVDRLGAKAAGLRPVLDWLRALSVEISQTGNRLAESLDALVGEVDRMVFGLSAAKLQIEMSAQFAHELIDHACLGEVRNGDDRMTEGAIGILHASSCETVRRALSGLEAIRERLKILTESQSQLLHTSNSLRPVYLTGKVEMADVAGAKLSAVFHDVGDQLQETRVNLDGLRKVLRDLDAHLDRGLSHGARVEETIMQINAQLDAQAGIDAFK